MHLHSRVGSTLIVGVFVGLFACGGSGNAGSASDGGASDATSPGASSTGNDGAVPVDGQAGADGAATDGAVPDAGSTADAGSVGNGGNGGNGNGQDAASAGDGGACSPLTTYGGGEAVVAATSVTAKIVDETGAPVAGQPVYICGIDICSDPGTTQANGSVTITTTLTEKKPAFKVGDTIDYNEIAIPLAAGATDFTKGGTAVLTLGALASKAGAALTPGTTATSGDVSIAVPAGATVGVDALVYATPSQQELRTARIPLDNDGPVLASAGVTGFGLLYGLAPAETTVCPPAAVTVALPHATTSPNDLGWAPGAAVEFWEMTTDTGQEWAPYAGWAKISDGAVSADGASVSTAAGQGFPFLETFAIRKP